LSYSNTITKYKYSATVDNTVLLKAVLNRLDAARSRHDITRNSTVERSQRNKLHTNYMLTTCSVPQFCHVQDEHGQWEN